MSLAQVGQQVLEAGLLPNCEQTLFARQHEIPRTPIPVQNRLDLSKVFRNLFIRLQRLGQLVKRCTIDANKPCAARRVGQHRAWIYNLADS
jgi:hypothetical protein